MNASLSVDQALPGFTQDLLHVEHAPALFLSAWKRAVSLVGRELFGWGHTPVSLEQIDSKTELRPNLFRIHDALPDLAPSEQVFLAALVSFYDVEEGQTLCKRAGVEGLADLSRLDLPYRRILADLLLHDTGWA
ncbi:MULTISPECIES: hypothetical protein [unclassified Serratia (in: enterobacteria)]|jgi:hypothetical protein|uniref:hypothetical protein n=1 Tax=unclassified Serratia (in: enterobacteria) TaxID=2647522 RepID=UPI00050843F8|nr:hypothetical protein [Serratia sp. Ag2]KFK91761.1 hypothetical protein JV45_24515 [Serratia sp. Ag2]